MTRLWEVMVVVGLVGMPAWAGVSGAVGTPEIDTATGPTLANVCLISTDVRRL